MKPWQARVLVEKTELDQKITNLRMYLLSPSNQAELDKFAYALLSIQLVHMEHYSQALAVRIATF